MKDDLELVKLLIYNHPSIVDLKNNDGEIGYGCLRGLSKFKIADYIREKNLNIKEPRF